MTTEQILTRLGVREGDVLDANGQPATDAELEAFWALPSNQTPVRPQALVGKLPLGGRDFARQRHGMDKPLSRHGADETQGAE